MLGDDDHDLMLYVSLYIINVLGSAMSEDILSDMCDHSDQPVHSHSLIRIFTGRM